MSLQVRAGLGRILGRTKSIVKGAWQRFRVTKSISSATTHIPSLFCNGSVPKEISGSIQYGIRGRGRTGLRLNAFMDDQVNQKTNNLNLALSKSLYPDVEFEVVEDEEHSPVSEDKELRSVMKLATGQVLRYNTSSQLPIKKGILAAIRAWLFYGKKR